MCYDKSMRKFTTFGTTLVITGLGFATVLAIGIPKPQPTPRIKGIKTLTAGAAMGMGSYINSIGTASDRENVANSLGELGGQWTRLEIPNNITDDYSGTDDAVSKIRAKNINILGLFSHQAGLTPSSFESFVETVVTRYRSDIKAWEIFNEIDNTLSASDYKPFLQKAHDKIKAIQSDGKVIVSGLTGRKEAIDYWNGLYDAGGGSYFDALGVHPYRTSAPETKEFNNGSLVDSINQAVTVINNHGGGKKIWLTEFGWKSGSVGESIQGHYLARGLALSASVSPVETIIPYRLWDNESDSYGILKTDYSQKSSFNTLKSAIANLQGKEFSERISATEQKAIDNFDSGVTGWKSDGAYYTLDIGSASGRNGTGLKFSWTFSSNTGYAIAEKFKSLAGEPTGLSVWINGNDSRSVWKLRIKESGGETFQFDLGQAPSGWHQFTFDFTRDKAKTSWGGNGTIDYPIQFESIVLDNQGGSTSGSAVIDDIYALYGDTDLYALKFGSTLAYWKVSGSSTTEVCGKTLTFEVYVKYTSVSSCTASVSIPTEPSPPAAEPSSPSTPSKTSTTKKSTTPSLTAASPPPPFDQTKSKVTVDTSELTADGQAKIIVRIDLKDSNDQPVQVQGVTVTVTGDHNIVTGPDWKDDHYEASVQSTGAGDKEIIVKVGDTQVGEPIKVVYTEPVKSAPTPAPQPKPPPTPPSTPLATPFYKNPLVLGVTGVSIVLLILLALFSYRLIKIRKLRV